MALIKHQLFGDVSGSVGGLTFTRNQAGKTIRARVKPTDAKSGAQIGNRSLFGAAAAQWNTLTDAIRTAWNTFAVTNFSGKTSNPSVRYSGMQAFASSNAVLASLVRALVTPTMSSPGATITLTGPPAAVQNAPTGSFNGNIQASDTSALTLQLDAGTYVASTGALTFRLRMPVAQAAAPIFQNPGGTVKVYFVVNFSNILKPGQNSVKKLLAYTMLGIGNITVGSGWTSSAVFTLNATVNPAYLSSLKLNFQTGSKFYLTVFAVSDKGQTSRIGSIHITAT
jgi:hypothetical protein